MLLKNICRDDLGMVYISSLRYCLIKKNDDDMLMLLNIAKKLFNILERRDYSCSIEDLINTNRFFGDIYDFTKNYECEDNITLLTHFMLANLVKIDCRRNRNDIIDKDILYRIFVDLNYFVFHNVEKDEAYEFIVGILNSKNFIRALDFISKETKIVEDDIVDFELEADELSFLCKNAIHYAVGRRTYVTTIVPNFINTIKEILDVETKDYIKDYILSLKEKDDKNENEYKFLGDNCDRVSWLKLVEKL